eukprot:4766568-Amphidinium_carterae.2
MGVKLNQVLKSALPLGERVWHACILDLRNQKGLCQGISVNAAGKYPLWRAGRTDKTTAGELSLIHISEPTRPRLI